MESSRLRDRDTVEFARIAAFTDGVFAIAITLLVLSLSVPENLPDNDLSDFLFDSRSQLFAYFLSFAVIGRFWIAHHGIFTLLRRFDRLLLVLTLAYLSMIVLIPFPAELLGDYGDQRLPVVIYAAVLGAAASLNLLMTHHAVTAGLVAGEHLETTARGRRFLFIPAIFLLSIPVALASPLAAELMWTALILARIARGLMDRRKHLG
jgi:uncharacterized membrane protein